MNSRKLIILKNLGLALGLFLVLALPGYLSLKENQVMTVSIQYPKQTRGIASNEEKHHSVPTKSCQPAQKWRYVCDKNRQNCVKDRMETYLKCKSL